MATLTVLSRNPRIHTIGGMSRGVETVRTGGIIKIEGDELDVIFTFSGLAWFARNVVLSHPSSYVLARYTEINIISPIIIRIFLFSSLHLNRGIIQNRCIVVIIEENSNDLIVMG